MNSQNWFSPVYVPWYPKFCSTACPHFQESDDEDSHGCDRFGELVQLTYDHFEIKRVMEVLGIDLSWFGGISPVFRDDKCRLATGHLGDGKTCSYSCGNHKNFDIDTHPDYQYHAPKPRVCRQNWNGCRNYVFSLAWDEEKVNE